VNVAQSLNHRKVELTVCSKTAVDVFRVFSDCIFLQNEDGKVSNEWLAELIKTILLAGINVGRALDSPARRAVFV